MDAIHKLSLRSPRLEALGDGIFSVAMTILAIELELPEWKEGSWKAMIASFSHVAPGLLCYIISFIVLGIMWFGHRMVFEYIGKSNRYFIFLGVLFYMVVCLVPFSTKILARNTFHWFPIVTYALNLSICNLLLYFQWVYGINRPNFLERPLPVEVKKVARVLFLISPILYFIAIVAGYFYPGASIFIFAVTPILYLLPNKLDEYLP